MRISVTTVEQFRKYRDGDITFEMLMKSIVGPYEPSRYADLGSAFHSILENPKDGIVNSITPFYRVKGIEFDCFMMQQAIAVMDYSGTFEVPFTKQYPVLSDNSFVTISGRADQLVGAKAIENKTVWTQYDFDNYALSCQWKFYLDMFELQAVGYNIFVMSETQSRGIELKSIEQFEMHSYPDLLTDLHDLINDMVFFINQQNLSQYFKDK